MPRPRKACWREQMTGVVRIRFRTFLQAWAVATDAPFTWTKQMAADFGGTRNGMVMHWPKGIQAKGEIRSQFHHVNDVAATILEATNLPDILNQ